jgi:hypothetical protein
VQDAGKPRLPSISTKHTLHDPKDFKESVAHNLGILIPFSAAQLKHKVVYFRLLFGTFISQFNYKVIPI